MASDHRYYKRFNFESAPMEEYEARDVSRRLVAPDVRFNATVVNERPTTGSNVLIQLDTYVENFSPAAAGFALVTFHVTSRNFPTTEGIDAAGETVLEHEGIAHPVHSYKLEWRGSTRLPLMQGARYHVARVSLSVADSVGPAHLFWEVLAPSADANRGAYRLSKHNTCFLIADAAGAWALSWAAHWRI